MSWLVKYGILNLIASSSSSSSSPSPSLFDALDKYVIFLPRRWAAWCFAEWRRAICVCWCGFTLLFLSVFGVATLACVLDAGIRAYGAYGGCNCLRACCSTLRLSIWNFRKRLRPWPNDQTLLVQHFKFALQQMFDYMATSKNIVDKQK